MNMYRSFKVWILLSIIETAFVSAEGMSKSTHDGSRTEIIQLLGDGSSDYDESNVEAFKSFGKDNYRVWKNSRKGIEIDLWKKDYNDTATGESWTYPEFKGFHDDFRFGRIHDSTGDLDINCKTDDISIRLFTPGEVAEPINTHADLPAGDLSFLHAIAPIGIKFKNTDQHGPEGQKIGFIRAVRHLTPIFCFTWNRGKYIDSSFQSQRTPI